MFKSWWFFQTRIWLQRVGMVFCNTANHWQDMFLRQWLACDNQVIDIEPPLLSCFKSVSFLFCSVMCKHNSLPETYFMLHLLSWTKSNSFQGMIVWLQSNNNKHLLKAIKQCHRQIKQVLYILKMWCCPLSDQLHWNEWEEFALSACVLVLSVQDSHKIA